MEIYDYKDFSLLDDFDYPDDLCSFDDGLAKKLKEEYDDFDKYSAVALDIQLPMLYNLTNGKLLKKRLLDLGCGSVTSYDNGMGNSSKMFEPWLCRGLYHAGANPVGIDCGSFDNEKFEGYQMNLLEENLDFLPDNSFDIVSARQVFNSPYLNFNLRDRGGCKLKKILLPQVKRILKLDGIFIYSQDSWQGRIREEDFEFGGSN